LAITSRAFSPPDSTRHRFSTSSPEKPKQPASARSEPCPACGNEYSSPRTPCARRRAAPWRVARSSPPSRCRRGPWPVGRNRFIAPLRVRFAILRLMGSPNRWRNALRLLRPTRYALRASGFNSIGWLSIGERALPKYISSQRAWSSKVSMRTSLSNFSMVTLPVKRR
jgi:hypothetical protein